MKNKCTSTEEIDKVTFTIHIQHYKEVEKDLESMGLVLPQISEGNKVYLNHVTRQRLTDEANKMIGRLNAIHPGILLMEKIERLRTLSNLFVFVEDENIPDDTLVINCLK